MARRELGPATLAAVQAVDAALGPADSRLIVACSGGADSLALAYAVRHVAHRRALPATAVIIDHGSADPFGPGGRAGASAAGRLGLTEARVVPVAVDRGSGQGLEAAAREARYAALGRGGGTGGGHGAARVTRSTTRPRRCCSDLLGGPGPGRWPAWPRAWASCSVRCSGCAGLTTEQACRGARARAVGGPAQRRPPVPSGPRPRGRAARTGGPARPGRGRGVGPDRRTGPRRRRPARRAGRCRRPRHRRAGGRAAGRAAPGAAQPGDPALAAPPRRTRHRSQSHRGRRGAGRRLARPGPDRPAWRGVSRAQGG